MEQRITKSPDHGITQSSFSAVTPYYDDLMISVPYQMWVGYYLLLLSQQDVHPKTILDVCCGTGTMCEMLFDEGFQTAGLDLSPGMIAEAKRKAIAKDSPIDYWCMDASTFELNRRFDAALSFYDSLNNITQPHRLQMAFQRVAEHLPPGSSFIFDLNTAYAFEQHMFDQQSLRPDSPLRYKWVGDWDPIARLITVHMKFWHMGEEFEETHVQRAYDEETIREMLSIAGFDDIEAYHSYTLDPPRKKSDRIHFAALKGS